MTKFILPLSSAEATDPDRVGPKAANLARLAQAGLPTPGGFCLTAAAYRAQVAALGLDDSLRRFSTSSSAEARKISVEIRLALYQQSIANDILLPLLAAWRAQCASACSGKVDTGFPTRTCANAREVEGVPIHSIGMRSSAQRSAVRSSALIEDRADANFAGQFESFLGLADEAELLTAVRACWAALWTSQARRALESHGLDPAGTAMAALIQPLVAARASGGGLSQTPEGGMVLSATWGLGSAIAQGEVVPDRIVLSRQGFVRKMEAGRKDRRETCTHLEGAVTQAVPGELVQKPCLDAGEAVTLGRLLRKAEDVMGKPVEIEWALDDAGFKLLQARPLHVQPIVVPDEIWLQHPGLSGHPAGIGWGSGRAVVVSCECELSRVAPGDVLVTKVAGPALAHILPRVAGVVAELGGSTSHLASLARERGIPMVLGVLDATRRIPDGSQVAVDGVAGIVRWLR
jgi:pyruvate, water dikinase